MLPTLRLTATSLEERLGSLSMAGGLAVPPEAAELDVMVDAIKVWSCARCQGGGNVALK